LFFSFLSSSRSLFGGTRCRQFLHDQDRLFAADNFLETRRPDVHISRLNYKPPWLSRPFDPIVSLQTGSKRISRHSAGRTQFGPSVQPRPRFRSLPGIFDDGGVHASAAAANRRRDGSDNEVQLYVDIGGGVADRSTGRQQFGQSIGSRKCQSVRKFATTKVSGATTQFIQGWLSSMGVCFAGSIRANGRVAQIGAMAPMDLCP